MTYCNYQTVGNKKKKKKHKTACKIMSIRIQCYLKTYLSSTLHNVGSKLSKASPINEVRGPNYNLLPFS